MKKHLFPFLAIFLFCVITSTSAQTIHYVKEGGSGDGSGTSWDNASDDLQDMINSSVAEDRIWVGKGTYYPIRKANALNIVTINNRDNAFVLKANVKMYGGFAGINETELTQRDSTGAMDNTILSGDIGTPGDSTDNAYHVIISADDVGTAELNGFTIKDGNADGRSQIVVSTKTIFQSAGGGIANSFSSPRLTNVIIGGNNATYGGGIHNNSSSPLLTNVTISGNGNSRTGGGGMQNESNSSPILTNVIISGNTGEYGGGISNYSSSPLLTNVTLSGNLAYRGAGIYNFQSSPILTNVTISGNNATGSGGGIFNSTDTYIEIRNSIIYGNSNALGLVSTSFSVISYCIVPGLLNWPNISSNNTFGINPGFISMPSFENAPFTGGDYRLQNGSYAINRGNNDFFSIDSTPDLSLITTDLYGNNRFVGIIDIGSYEYLYPLPVTIVNYTAQAEGNSAKLKWTTTTESNNKEFIILHSATGKDFKEIGKVAGAGNTTSQKEYVYYDENPFNGINFYQLTQMDYDGRSTDIGIRTVDFSLAGNNLIKVYPNPVKNSVRIEFAANTYHQAELTDVNGKILQRLPLSTFDTEKKMDMSNLSSGIYFIKLSGNDSIESRKIVKE